MKPTALQDSLLAWARQVFASAGVAPTPEQVNEIAGTIAHLIMSEKLVPFAAANDVSELFAGWHDQVGVRRANVLEHIDGARSILIVMIADKKLGAHDGPERASIEHEIAEELDALIAGDLASSRDEFVRGVGEEFGSAAAEQEVHRTAATAGTTAGGGCLVTLLTMAVFAVVMSSSSPATTIRP
jgi:hypothetical protein